MSSRITYEPKVSITTSNVPANNQVRDTDMNEIRTVVNANAAELEDTSTSLTALSDSVNLFNNGIINGTTPVGNSSKINNYQVFVIEKGQSISGFPNNSIILEKE